jgi:hypothetical protein
VLVTPVFVLVLLAFRCSSAHGHAFLPPEGRLFAGVAGQPVSSYVRAVGKHPAVYEEFIPWGQWLPGLTRDAGAADARLMIHITTRYGAREAITPGAIAGGAGDRWLIGLNRAIDDGGLVTYVRPMAEMDAYWNAYCAFNADGTRRDPAHSTSAYKRAWARIALIMRGGPVARIDRQLRELHMPPLPVSHDLPTPRVAMAWVPQSAGAPDVAGNQPRDYWPGRRWVDWVGTDFYGKYPNFSGLGALYDAYPRLPFVFGEYALWDSDDPGWIERLFAWIGTHRRTRMMIYNQGLNPGGPFRLSRYPRAALALRRHLASPTFPAYAPELSGSARGAAAGR